MGNKITAKYNLLIGVKDIVAKRGIKNEIVDGM